jgi:hypothetical protein
MTILSLLISLVIWGLIFWLLYWALGSIAVPEPFNKVANVILVVATVVVIIGLLTGSIPPFHFLSSALR